MPDQPNPAARLGTMTVLRINGVFELPAGWRGTPAEAFAQLCDYLAETMGRQAVVKRGRGDDDSWTVFAERPEGFRFGGTGSIAEWDGSAWKTPA